MYSYIAHLRYYVSTIIAGKNILSGAFESVIPPELSAIGSASMAHSLDIFRETFSNEFQWSEGMMSYQKAVKNRNTFIAYLKQLIYKKTFQNDRDLAIVSFCFYI